MILRHEAANVHSFSILMKRYGNLFNKIISKENIRKATRKAAKGKRWRRSVQQVERRISVYTDRIHEMLKNGEYRTAKYQTKEIYEPKKRTIYILPFYPDRIVQHAIMNVIEPIWDRTMYYHSYSCRKKKGQHAGSDQTLKYVKKYKYVLKGDVSKFYPSMNHDVLKQIIRRKIKDEKVLQLLDEIIDSAEGNTNVPIGNYLSQWFGNIYLNELDDFVKHELRVKGYVRYCDDFCLFSDSKIMLHKWRLQILQFVQEKLQMALSKSDVFKSVQGVDFLGYRHFPAGHRLVRRPTLTRIRRRLRKLENKINSPFFNSLRANGVFNAAKGWFIHANAFNLKRAIKMTDIENKLSIASVPKYKTFAQVRQEADEKLYGKQKTVSEVLNKPLLVTGFKMLDCRNKVLFRLFIVKDGIKCYIISGSRILRSQLQGLEEAFPFTTTITQRDNYYLFQ